MNPWVWGIALHLCHKLEKQGLVDPEGYWKIEGGVSPVWRANTSIECSIQPHWQVAGKLRSPSIIKSQFSSSRSRQFMPFQRVRFQKNQFTSALGITSICARTTTQTTCPPGKEDAEGSSLAHPLPAKLPKRHQAEATQVTGILKVQGGLWKSNSKPYHFI